MINNNKDKERTTEHAWTAVARRTYPDTEIIDDRSVWWVFGHAGIPGTDGELDPPGPEPVVVRKVQICRDIDEESPEYDRLN